MDNTTNMNLASQQEFARLKAVLNNLNLKYTPEVYATLAVEPEEVLAYCRDVIRFSSRRDVTQHDSMDLYWKTPTG